jgi:hypothetical protein
MNKAFLIIFLIICLFQTLVAQNKSDILIIDLKYDTSISVDKLVKEINVPREPIKKTKRSLLQQCIDSTKFYGGNCFKVTYYDDNEFYVINGHTDYIRGEIYILDESDIHNIQTIIEKNKPSKTESHSNVFNNSNDSLKVKYEANFVFQYGGESKLALILPKINLLRKHQTNSINPYYGIEFGLHTGFVGGYGSLSGIFGIEKNIYSIETSASHFRTTKISDGEGGYSGPYSQNLINLKLGIQIKKVRLKVGTSFLLNENIPQGQERIDLLDLGKINGTIYGIELQLKIM